MKKGTLIFLSMLVVFAVFAAWSTDSFAYLLYTDGCNSVTCHGDFRSGTTSAKPGNTWPTNKHDVHRNTMLAGVCGACHTGSPNASTTFTNSSDGNASLPGLGCLGCHGNNYSGTYKGAGLRAHHRNSGANTCGATSCHPGDPAPKPESDNPPYYGLTGVNITNALNTDGKENYTSDGLGLDNDGDLLYDQVAAAFAVSKPAAGESVPTGAAYAVTWTAATGAASYKVKLSIDGGATWSTLGTGLSDTTTSWNVPTNVKKNITNAIIKVIAYNSNNQKLGAVKSGTFSIDVLTITAPAAGATVPQNAPYTITWTANGTAAAPDQVVVKYSLNNGSTWKTAAGTLGASSFSWNVPAVPKTKNNAKVKVVLKVAGVTVANAVSGTFKVVQ